jgi:hypothetical protein
MLFLENVAENPLIGHAGYHHDTKSNGGEICLRTGLAKREREV